jgi:hypothetical protein
MCPLITTFNSGDSDGAKGNVNVESGTTLDSNEVRAGQLLTNLEYDVSHRPTENSQETPDVRTMDLSVKDVGQIDPAAAGFVVCALRAVASAESLPRLFCFLPAYVLASNPVVIVGCDGDVAVAVIDAEQDLLSGQEARAFEHRVGNLHPREGRVSLMFVCAVCFKRNGNARGAFAASATWFNIGVSHDQLLC